jgi:hypothetical protein
MVHGLHLILVIVPLIMRLPYNDQQNKQQMVHGVFAPHEHLKQTPSLIRTSSHSD